MNHCANININLINMKISILMKFLVWLFSYFFYFSMFTLVLCI